MSYAFRMTLLFIILAFVAACDAPTQSAGLRERSPLTALTKAVTSTEVLMIPVEFTIPVGAIPCITEAIDFSGRIHVVVHSTQDEGGGVHYEEHVDRIDLAGVGASSEETYRLVGSITDIERNNPFFNRTSSSTFTFLNVFKLIGPTGLTLDATALFHLTRNESGELTARVIRFEVKCYD